MICWGRAHTLYPVSSPATSSSTVNPSAASMNSINSLIAEFQPATRSEYLVVETMAVAG
jgi:hypothetical protein